MDNTEKHMYAICVCLLSLSLFLIISLASQQASTTGFTVEQSGAEQKRSDALNALITANSEIEDMRTFGLGTYFLEDSLLLAEQSYVGDNVNAVISEYEKEAEKKKRDYFRKLLYIKSDKKTNLSEVFRITQSISQRKNQAYTLLDEISLLEEKINAYKEKGINTEEQESILVKAKSALKEERYQEAEDYINSAKMQLEESQTELTRLKNLATLSRGFFREHWLPSLATLIALLIITYVTINEARAYILKNKIKGLELKKETIYKLMKKLQDERFVKGKISDATYKVMMEKHKDELARIEMTVPVLRAMLEKRKKGEAGK